MQLTQGKEDVMDREARWAGWSKITQDVVKCI